MAEHALPSAAPLETSLEFERLLSGLSSRFINLPPGEVDREIDDALRRVCELVGIDFAVLWQWSIDDPSVLMPTHVYTAQQGSQPAQPLDQEQYPWVVGEMRAGRMVVLSSMEELPADAVVDRESALQSGIKSDLCLPLEVGGAPPVGALAFNTLKAERTWPDELVKRLQLVAQVFTNALVRRRDEIRLRKSEERLALAADSAEAGLWTLDFSTGVFWATDSARGLFGYSPDEVLNMERFESSVHPDDWDLVREAVERAAVEGEPVSVEYRVVDQDNDRVRWFDSRGRPRFKPTGEPECLMGISFDITERNRGEEELRRSEARREAGADLAGIGFYEVDFRERRAFLDDRILAIWGIPPEREDGLGPVEFWMEHLHPDDREHVLEVREQLHGGQVEPVAVEYRFLHPTTGERWIQHQACVATRDASGNAIQSYGAICDITERRRAEEALRQSLAEIEQLKDRLQAETDYLRAEINVAQVHSEVTGQSKVIQMVLHQVEQVAPTDSTVLVHGETGTGKELVAQAIHRLSPRRQHVMVKINCAALPSGLIESELFGREKGAFTGALTRQIGRFEVADRSTLFLDEVGELPFEVQAKLLRVLEAGEFERLGSPRTIKVDVRVIAATNRDLTDAVRQGRFREDLFYRLNVFPIRVPPLRERTEDIPILVWTFLEEFSSRMGKKIIQVPRKTMDVLQRHPWPGNVRQLRNVIEHGAIITTGETLKIPAFDEATTQATVPMTLAEAEREFIVRALERTNWRIKGPKGAATELGLNPGTLYGRMKKLGIQSRRPAEDNS